MFSKKEITPVLDTLRNNPPIANLTTSLNVPAMLDLSIHSIKNPNLLNRKRTRVDQQVKEVEILSSEEREEFRNLRDKAVAKFTRLASCLTLPITALGFFAIDGTATFLDIYKVMIPTYLIWYGSYFTMLNKWTKQEIKKDERFKLFTSAARAKANTKVFFAAEITWLSLKGPLDMALIGIASNIFESTKIANTMGGVLSHFALAFIAFPKLIMPIIHKHFDEKKQEPKASNSK